MWGFQILKYCVELTLTHSGRTLESGEKTSCTTHVTSSPEIQNTGNLLLNRHVTTLD